MKFVLFLYVLWLSSLAALQLKRPPAVNLFRLNMSSQRDVSKAVDEYLAKVEKDKIRELEILEQKKQEELQAMKAGLDVLIRKAKATLIEEEKEILALRDQLNQLEGQLREKLQTTNLEPKVLPKQLKSTLVENNEAPEQEERKVPSFLESLLGLPKKFEKVGVELGTRNIEKKQRSTEEQPSPKQKSETKNTTKSRPATKNQAAKDTSKARAIAKNPGKASEDETNGRKEPTRRDPTPSSFLGFLAAEKKKKKNQT